MINQIHTGIKNNSIVNSEKQLHPSFGFAALNPLGKRTSDSFGYTRNRFLDPNMFKKQGIFEKSALSAKLARGDNFVDICNYYGCTNNSKTNADFIVNQILSPKSATAISNLSDEDYEKGLMSLYTSNYDNPKLSYHHTRQLLEMLNGVMEEEDFVKYSGILEVGTK